MAQGHQQPVGSADLATWFCEPADTYRRMLGHAQFPAAVRVLAANMLDLGAADPVLLQLFKDAGRYVAALFAIYLHHCGGITLARLKALVTQSGYLSPGRARSMLQFLVHVGYLVPAPRTKSGIAYLPTAAFVDAWTAQVRAALASAALIEPGVERLTRRLHEPPVLAAFVQAHTEGLMALTQGADHSPPYISIFMHRHGGTQIVWTILNADDGTDFPTRAPLPCSISGLARQFKVSRMHVRRLIDDAVNAKLLTLAPNRTIMLQEPARESIRFVFAHQLIELLRASAKAMQATAGGFAETEI